MYPCERDLNGSQKVIPQQLIHKAQNQEVLFDHVAI